MGQLNDGHNVIRNQITMQDILRAKEILNSQNFTPQRTYAIFSKDCWINFSLRNCRVSKGVKKLLIKKFKK
jgi:hypothetical protein